MDVDQVQQSLKNTAQEAVEHALKLGVEQAEVGVSYDEGFSVTVRLGELESIERQRDRSLAVTVYAKGRKGSASTTECSSGSVEETVRKAISIANFTSEDDYAGLAEPELMAREQPDLDL